MCKCSFSKTKSEQTHYQICIFSSREILNEVTKSRINLACGGRRGCWGCMDVPKFNICKDKYAKSIWKWQHEHENSAGKRMSKWTNEWVSEWARKREWMRKEEHVPNINTSDIVCTMILLQSKATAAPTTGATSVAATATAADKHHTPRLVWHIHIKQPCADVGLCQYSISHSSMYKSVHTFFCSGVWLLRHTVLHTYIDIHTQGAREREQWEHNNIRNVPYTFPCLYMYI